jgi:hypothetical protein
MRRFMRRSVVVALAMLFAIPLARNAMAGGTNANGIAQVPVPAATKVKPNNGKVKCTAAINFDGSILNCKHCNPTDTGQISTGQYQVGFTKPCTNILAVDGWSRWVQADTLSTGDELAFCTTADRAGDVNAIFVECFDDTGADVNASFFLFVAH